MKLRRLRVEQLRRFRAPFELAGLTDGINLFTGDNEAGKSTLVRAIRAAFFERHRSTTVDDLRPWGDEAAVPQVELEFDLGGERYRLSKSFLGRKRAALAAGTRRWDGEEAEQHLAGLLGFGFAAKGASRPEHQGIPGLLWIEQGTGQAVHDAVEHAGAHLRQALGEASGALASSQGDALIARVRQERGRLLTDKTGKPREGYLEALTTVAAQAEELRALDEQIGQYRERVDSLDRLRREHGDDEQRQPWQAVQEQLVAAQQRLDALTARQRDLAAEQAVLKGLQERHALLAEELARDTAAQQQLAQREAATARAQAASAAADAEADEQAARLTGARDGHAQAVQRRAQAEDAARRGLLAQQAAAAEAAVQGAEQRLAEVKAEHRRVQALRERAHEAAVDPAALQRLRQRHEALRTLAIRREAVAPRLRFDLAPGAAVTAADEPLAGRGERLLAGTTVIAVAGVGELVVVPGGQDLAALAHEERQLRAEQAAELQRLAAADLDAVQARADRHAEAQRELKAAETLLARLAPKGGDAIAAELTQHRAAAAAARAEMARIEGGAAPDGADGIALSLPEARAAEAGAKALLDTVAAAAAKARESAVAARVAATAAGDEAGALRARLADPALLERRRALPAQLAALAAERDVLAARLGDEAAAYAAAQPEQLAQDVRRLRASVDSLRARHDARGQELAKLSGELHGMGAQGLEERRALLAAEHEAGTRRVAELAMRAQALSLLLERLEAKRRTSVQRLHAPLQQHLQRYLPLLFPQAAARGRAEFELDEALRPRALHRSGNGGGEISPFHDLSYGAREQLGLVTRLAYADFLQASGRPTLLILDDALVHSDHQRLERMKRVLFDAAERHQVLLFSCHPRAWEDLGVAARVIGS